MNDPKEQTEMARAEAESAEGAHTRREDKATDAAPREEELGVEVPAAQDTGDEGDIIGGDVPGDPEHYLKGRRKKSDRENGDIEKAAKVVWETFVQLQQDTRAVAPQRDGFLSQNHIDIINQYNVLRAVLAGPPETEEERVPDPVAFPPTPDKDFAPQLPLPDWKPS